MGSSVDVVNTKIFRRFGFLNYRHLYGAAFYCLTIYMTFAQCFFSSDQIYPDRYMTVMKRMEDPTVTEVSQYETSILHQGSTLNTISGLFELAEIFDKDGEPEIATAIYWRLLNGLISEDTKLPQTRRTALSYFCHYRISRCYLFLNETQKAIIHANQAFQILPRREPYYHVARFFDKQKHDDSIALPYYRLAANAPEPPADAPFREANVYAVDIERDILWPKVFPQEYLQKLSWYQDILDDAVADEDAHSQTHDEMILISRALFSTGYEEIFRKEGPFRLNETDNEFYYSTPTIVRLHPDRADDFLIVCRLINYRIDPEFRWYRDYLPPGGEPHSLKSAMALHRGIGDDEGTLIKILDDALVKSTSQVIGPEDPKILRAHGPGGQSEEGDIVVIMTSWEYPSIAGNGSRMASGIIDPELGVLEVSHAFPSPYNREWEKNWVMFQIPGGQEATLHFIYEWHPLKIGTLLDETNHTIDFHTIIDTPRSFKFLRGSTNGVMYQQEVWFIVHGVGKIGYTYYHKIVVLDAQTLHVRRHSYPFKLEGLLPTEFCLGLDIDEESKTMTIAYSVLDGSSVLRRIALWKMEALMVT